MTTMSRIKEDNEFSMRISIFPTIPKLAIASLTSKLHNTWTSSSFEY